MLRIRLCALLVLCTALPSAWAAPAAVIETTTLDQARPARRDFLKQLTQAEATVAANATASPDARIDQGPNMLEWLGVQQSNAGDVDGAMKTFDQRHAQRKPRVPRVSDEALAELHAEEAIQAIVAAARDRRVVLINEAHHVPLHRAFTMKLARALRKIGFQYFAAETLSRDGVGSDGKPVSVNDGAYIREPQYAELLRDVGREGWTVVAYESRDEPPGPANGKDAIQHRETVQARNLVEKVLQAHPDAKLLVHVGYFHLDKRPGGTAGGVKLMGTLLRELGGVEPLAVDQTNLMAHVDPSQEWAPYRQFVQAKGITQASVLRKTDGAPFVTGVSAASIDLQVIHPPYGMAQGRPAWLASIAGRSAVDVPLALVPTAGRRLVYAYRADDTGPDAVPVDTLLLQPGEKPASLMLPAGRFRLEVED